MAKLDSKELNLSFSNSKFFKNAALEIAQSKMTAARRDFLDEFSSHPVTVEIDMGPEAQNYSGTLGGYDGNLFSFIGFDADDNPTELVKGIIERIRVTRRSTKKIVRRGCEITFRTTTPSLDEFEARTPLPWESGRSWLTGISSGITGFGRYLRRDGAGRSEGGLQVRGKIRAGQFSRVSYFVAMYKRFLDRLQ